MKKYLHAARNDRPYILRPREHSAFYAKLYSGKDLPKVINVSTNKSFLMRIVLYVLSWQ